MLTHTLSNTLLHCTKITVNLVYQHKGVIIFSMRHSFEVEVTLWLAYLSTNIFRYFPGNTRESSLLTMWSGVTWISLFYNTCKQCSGVKQNRNVQTMSLTSACWVHSNVYALVNIRWIRYFTAVDSLHSTSFPVHTYDHLTSVPVKIPFFIKTGNSTSIGKEPVSYDRPIFTSIKWLATSSEVSHAEQGLITFTNVLQGHTTVVLVCCTIKWEPDITCIWEVWIFNRKYKCSK